MRLAKSERERAWMPPCAVATMKARSRNCDVCAQVVADDGDEHVDGEAEIDRLLGADAVGQAANMKANGTPTELDHEDGGQEVGWGIPISSPKVVAMRMMVLTASL
jgi:hypothetical protein